jgi:hypothetical protein
MAGILPPMHPRTSELLDHLKQSRDALKKAVDATPAELRDKKPAADRWSVAQVLEHLVHVESGITTMLSRGLRKLEKDGLRPATEVSPVLPTIDSKRLLDRGAALVAPEPVQPRTNLTSDQAMQALTDARGALETTLLAGDGIDVDAIRGPHPFLGELRFHQWLAFVGFHEQRHAAQIEATAQLLQG